MKMFRLASIVIFAFPLAPSTANAANAVPLLFTLSSPAFNGHDVLPLNTPAVSSAAAAGRAATPRRRWYGQIRLREPRVLRS